MFLRLGMCCGPIVAADDETVTFECYQPYERDGERITIERKTLLPFAESEVRIWQELTSQ